MSRYNSFMAQPLYGGWLAAGRVLRGGEAFLAFGVDSSNGSELQGGKYP